jgi:hypothetical protein
MQLYIIESPLQLLSAIEAKKKFLSQKHILIVKYSKEKKNNDQINFLIKNSSWDKVYKIPFLFSTKLQIIFFCLLANILKKISFHKIFIGEFRSDEMWMMLNSLHPNEAFLLDDGNMTIEVQTHYLKNINDYNIKRKKKKDILFKYFRLKSAKRKMINLFTMFELKPYINQKIVSNDFSVIASQIKNSGRFSDNSRIYFIGANIIELGIVTEKYFFDCMKFINHYYQNKNMKVVYLPHRREKKEKLEKMKRLFDFEIQQSEFLLELYFYYKKINPKHIASFYSTALFSLKKIYNCSTVDAFKLDSNQIQKIYRSEIESTYRFYKNYMQIIELNEEALN